MPTLTAPSTRRVVNTKNTALDAAGLMSRQAERHIARNYFLTQNGAKIMSDAWVGRRAFLASVGTAGTLTIAGCSSADSTTTPPPTTESQPTDEPTTEATDTQTEATAPSGDTLHVSPEGSPGNPATEAEPLSSVQAAITRATPGQTVLAHPGEYVEYIEFTTDGEEGAPITLTGPEEAVLKPPVDVDHQAVSVGASHIHIKGMTVTGLHDPENPDAAESYHAGKLIDLNPFAEHGDDYIEGLVISPHRIGNAGQSLINSRMIKESDIGGFEVIGPAGAGWLFDESTDGHNGEFVYLGSANRASYGFEGFDRTRNVRVHHIDNSAGHAHSELVDCKPGVEDITVEYCTDGGGAQSTDSYYSQSISLNGYACTVRWNDIRDAAGSGVEFSVGGALGPVEAPGDSQPEVHDRIGTENAVYGNVFTRNTTDAIDFMGESKVPGHERNLLPAEQRVICGNRFDGHSDADPGAACDSEIPSGDGVGHLGGDSPWDGDAPTKQAVFERNALATDLETSVETSSAPAGERFEATVTMANTGDSSKQVELGLRVTESLLESATVSIPAGETRTSDFGHTLPDPNEVSITRHGQRIGTVTVEESS